MKLILNKGIYKHKVLMQYYVKKQDKKVVSVRNAIGKS